MKILTLPLLAPPAYCIYLTQSKGAFLSAFAALVTALTFGRPKTVQIFILAFAMTTGIASLYTLPRMGELNKTRADQAIQGRIAAFRFGLTKMKNETYGIGFNQFQKEFAKAHHYNKAPHSSYVRVGSELGRTGLFLFLGVIYCCLRTLVMCKTADTAEERVRRILFVLLICYIVSSWMVESGFRASFFLMAAAIAAFHRQLYYRGKNALEQDKPKPVNDPVVIPVLQPALAGTVAAAPIPGGDLMRQTRVDENLPPGVTHLAVTPVDPEPIGPGLKWNRLGIIDAALMIALTMACERFWNYVLRNI